MAIPPRFHRWPWKEPVAAQIDEELAFHRDMRIRALVARGMPLEEARREADRRLRPAVRSRLLTAAVRRDRSMKRHEYLRELAHDAASACRQLRKQPGFSLLAILTLALGIGGATSIFSALYAVVFATGCAPV